MKKILYKIFDKFTFNQLPYLNFFIEMEKKSISELREFQLERLKGISDIQTWDQFYKLPITTKKDLPNAPKFPDKEILGSSQS